jgi:uncharacterized protein
MINKNNNYAIIGASNNQEKYGFKVLKNLYEKGFKVIPINPKEDIIMKLKCYHSLNDYYNKNIQNNPNLENNLKKIDVVIFIVKPKITQEILKEVKQFGINKVWMQPGSENDNAINFCKENNIEVIYNMCIMLKSKD